MREASYEDEQGRMFKVLLPDGVPDSDAAMGLPIGPPSLETLFDPNRIGTFEELEVNLHNQLFRRNLLTAKDVKLRRSEVLAALISTFKVGVRDIVNLYLPPPEQPAPKPKKEAKPPARRQTGKKNRRR